MFLYAGTRTNEWLETNKHFSTLYLMSGNVPSSMSELQGRLPKDLVQDSVCAVELSSRSNGRFTQFLHERMSKRANFKNEKSIAMIKDVSWMSVHSNYKDAGLETEVNLSQHFSKLFFDVSAPSDRPDYNFGSKSGSQYELLFEMEKAVHATGIQSTITWSTSSFYGHVYGGRITPTTFTQVDETLDLSAAALNDTVRVRDIKKLPADLVAVSDLRNGVVVEMTASGWESKGLQDSFDWVKANDDRIQFSTRDTDRTFDNSTWIADKEKFEFFRLENDGTTSFGLKGKWIGFTVEADDLPDYGSLPTQDITWGVLVPQIDDAGTDTYVSEVTGDAPMFLVDVGLPNADVAATVSETTGITSDTDVTLMNLKLAINWMGEKA